MTQDLAAPSLDEVEPIDAKLDARELLTKGPPASSLDPESLYSIGVFYHRLAAFEEAADFYEHFAAASPEDQRSDWALRTAAELRNLLDQSERALENYQRYIKLAGDELENAAIARFRLAHIYEEQADLDNARRQYQIFLSEFGDDADHDRRLLAHVEIGMSHWNQEGSNSRELALDAFRKAVELYQSIPSTEQSELCLGREATARAKFMLAEHLYQTVGESSVDTCDWSRWLEGWGEMQEVGSRAIVGFLEAVEMRHAEWAIASLYRIGAIYDESNAVLDDWCDQCVDEVYRGLVCHGDVSRALTHYELVRIASSQTRVCNEYTTKAALRLRELDGHRAQDLPELRAVPGYRNEGFERAEFITEPDTP